MKIRTDFVTNSSSSSFIIEKGQCTYGKLIKLLLKMANTEYSFFYNDGLDEIVPKKKYKKHYKLKDFGWDDDCGCYGVANYFVFDATKDHPYKYVSGINVHINDEEEKEYINEGREVKEYTNHYIVDNFAYGSRYDWDVISDILDEAGIEWFHGYCD